MPVSEQPGVAAGLLARGYAFVVVSLRYLIVGGWAAVVVLAIMFLPPLNATSTGGLSQLIPPGSAAARAESDAARLFGFPIDAAVAVVQRDPQGMPAATRDRALRQALSADRQLPGQPAGPPSSPRPRPRWPRRARPRPPGSSAARRARLRRAASPGWPGRSRCPMRRAC